MKTNKITTSILAIALLVGMNFTASAQRGQGMQGMGLQAGQGFNQDRPIACAYLDLTETQQTQIKDLRLALTEKNLTLRNQLGEMRAKMQTLRTGDNQDLKAISNLIDEMSKVQAQIRKNAAEHHLAVRALLTDDQKVMFDARQGKGSMAKKGNMGKRGNAMRGNRPNCPVMNR